MEQRPHHRQRRAPEHQRLIGRAEAAENLRPQMRRQRLADEVHKQMRDQIRRDGIGPDQLLIRELMVRLSDSNITEVILATDPNLEGEATATYLARLIKPLGIKVSRLASGLPVGGDLEYADEVTLGRAFEGRRNVEG